MGVLFCDMDGFKIVNDTLGHDVGDLILVEVGQRIDGCLREDDTVARLGGDEFAIILDGTSHIDAVDCSEPRARGAARAVQRQRAGDQHPGIDRA